MIRFLFITDTHIGADSMEFHQQPAYAKKVKQLLFHLREQIENCSIDFIIHGGDLVHTCKPQFIREAYNLFKFSVPTYLCLGNHDLDDPNALNIWLNYASELFISDSPNYEIVTDTCVIHVYPNHWESERAFYWGEIQEPFLSEEQIKQLEANLQKNMDKVHLLVTHSPIFGMSTEQSKLSQVIHEPPASFRNSITKLTQKYPHLKVVLSGHNHLNTLKVSDDCVYMTGSSFIETPFEYKLVEVDKSHIKISTCRINPSELDFVAEYNHERQYVQGREQDRELVMDLEMRQQITRGGL
ncbi:metallophosphoesterase family protein [Bacillus niameyensis]|uniref:metallophosphoesterase family protein n=1 Tax=Bacillus niameyensis TaxID=1522308 RepID=UPI00078557E1|nr:metallophosphoesterase [Bacillus niameyensis]